MNPRQFINQLRSPSGILVLFLIGLTIVLIMINSRRGPESGLGSRSVLPTPVSGQQLKQTIERDMSPFNPPRENNQPEREDAPTPRDRPRKRSVRNLRHTAGSCLANWSSRWTPLPSTRRLSASSRKTFITVGSLSFRQERRFMAKRRWTTHGNELRATGAGRWFGSPARN